MNWARKRASFHRFHEKAAAGWLQKLATPLKRMSPVDVREMHSHRKCLVVLCQARVADTAHLVALVAIIGLPGIIGVADVEYDAIAQSTVLLFAYTFQNLAFLDGDGIECRVVSVDGSEILGIR